MQMCKPDRQVNDAEFREEARRLSEMPTRQREEALDVHRRIADDASLSQATRNHARYVLDTLEKLLKPRQKKPKSP
jgi:hypothetical protein